MKAHAVDEFPLKYVHVTDYVYIFAEKFLNKILQCEIKKEKN